MVQITVGAIYETDVIAAHPTWGFDPGDSFTYSAATMPFYTVIITDNGADQTTLSGDVQPGINSDGGPNADNEGQDGETGAIFDPGGSPYGTQNQLVAVDKVGVLSGSDGSTINMYEIETFDDDDFYTFNAYPVEGVTYTLTSVVHDDPMPYASIICFVAGTQIATPDGEAAVETLRPGDLIRLADGRDEPVIWTGNRSVTAEAMAADPDLAPVRIAPNTLGRHRALHVSGQHRIFLSEGNARALADRGSCFVSAKLLAEEVGGPFRRTTPSRTIDYHHIMCASHEVVLANGVAAESFYPGPAAIGLCQVAARLSLFRLYPALATARSAAEIAAAYGPVKYPCVRRRDIRNASVQRARMLVQAV